MCSHLDWFSWGNCYIEKIFIIPIPDYEKNQQEQELQYNIEKISFSELLKDSLGFYSLFFDHVFVTRNIIYVFL